MNDEIKIVKEGDLSYKFFSRGRKEKGRIKSIFKKETGTIEWLRSLNKEDILYDVGANIGIYTIYAAPRVKKVIAFEPHLGNAHRLLENIELNGFNNVNLIAAPIHNKIGLFDFSYRSLTLGESFNQLSEKKVKSVERKLSLDLDFAIDSGWLPAPTCLKLDVDGNEFVILEGMEKTLRKKTIKSLIVEYNGLQGETVKDNRLRKFLEGVGYRFVESQFTSSGKSQLRKGRSADKIDHNFLFEL